MSEYEFSDDDAIIAQLVSEAEQRMHNQQPGSRIAKDVFGEDGQRRVQSFQQRKRHKRSPTTQQHGGRVPIASTPTAHRDTPPFFRITSSEEVRPKEAPEFRRVEHCTLLTIEHNLQRQDIVLEIDSELSRLFKQIMAPFLDKCDPQDRLSITLCFEQLTVGIFVHTTKANFNPDALQNQLYQIAQSKRGNFLNGTLCVRVAIIKSSSRQQMSGAKNNWNKTGPPRSADERSFLKYSVICIQNSDNLCGFRALAVGIYYQVKIFANARGETSSEARPDNGDDDDEMHESNVQGLGLLNKLTRQNFKSIKEINKKWQNMRKPAYKLQKEVADELRIKAGVDRNEPLKSSNIQQVEASLDGFKIIVVNRANKERVYPRQLDMIPEKYVILEYIPRCPDYPEGHYNAITKINAYMELPKFCIKCWVGEKRKETVHNCNPNCCQLCLGTHSPDNTDTLSPGSVEIQCNICNALFTNQQCFDLHLANKRCHILHQCSKCHIKYKPQTDHSCFTYNCPRCNQQYQGSPHFCNLESLSVDKLREEDRKPKILIAFDIESQLIGMEHKPVLLVAQTTCCHFKKNEGECQADREKKLTLEDPVLDTDIYAPCGLCEDKEEHWFLGKNGCTNVVESFIQFVMEESERAAKKKGKVIVYAHNSRGYDCHFILRELIRLGYENIKPLMSGSKIMKLSLGNIKFVDSLCLFQLPLKSLPKAFGLSGAMKKGDFPHKFNVEENLHKVTAWPDISYYEPEKKSPSEARAIRQYVEEMRRSGAQFDFDKELLEYCRMDVDILLKSLVKFRETFISITHLDPITRCFTLASIAMETYKAKFYDSKDAPIGITPKSYSSPKQHSVIGDCWMDWGEKQCRNPHFTREQRVGLKWVDAAILPQKKVFEFNGCIYHGCPKCYPNPNTPSIHDNGKTMGDLYKDWLAKEKYLKNLGFSVYAKWECELNNDRRSNPALNDFITQRMQYYQKLKNVGTIYPRDALFGGRTNNIKFYCDADGVNSELKYLDFTSLYPFEVSKKKYPIGHPKVIRQNFDPTMNFVGLSRCKVLPPKRLRFGVLPVRMDNKLVFPLCTACATTRKQHSCRHSDQDRCIIGTWATPELRFAIRDGYTIIEVYEEHRFSQEKSEMFSGYIKLWMKEKQEASGWPSWCDTPANRQQYIKQYLDREEIELDASKIEHNPGRRFIAKLMLNSFWGKFAQRSNMGQTAIITSPQQYFEIIEDPSKEITADEMVNENTMLVGWSYIDDDCADPGNTNVIIASFVTCYARLELLTKLKEIEQHRRGRVLYFDTDSIIFEHRNGDPQIETGDYLGQLTDEIAKDYGPSAKCIEFVSGGPKNYALKIKLPDASEKIILKAKGITLNEETQEKVTFSEMRRLVEDYIGPDVQDQENIVVDQFQIRADPNKLSVKSRYYKKIYRVVSEKRRIVGNDTLPFGYVDTTDDEEDIEFDEDFK